jgi:hypothetical protein
MPELFGKQVSRKKIVATTVFVLVSPFLVVLTEYADLPGKDSQGRTKNALSTVIAGLIGQRRHGHSDIDLTIQKQFFPDAVVTGSTSNRRIETRVPVTFVSNVFNATIDERGYVHGRVEKSEFDWQVEQVSATRYRIKRWGPKFDGTLELQVADGRISGSYIRNGVGFNWTIDGSYSGDNVRVHIDAPLTLGIVLAGTIAPGEP